MTSLCSKIHTIRTIPVFVYTGTDEKYQEYTLTAISSRWLLRIWIWISLSVSIGLNRLQPCLHFFSNDRYLNTTHFYTQSHVASIVQVWPGRRRLSLNYPASWLVIWGQQAYLLWLLRWEKNSTAVWRHFDNPRWPLLCHCCARKAWLSFGSRHPATLKCLGSYVPSAAALHWHW